MAKADQTRSVQTSVRERSSRPSTAQRQSPAPQANTAAIVQSFMTRPDAVNPAQVLHLRRAIGDRAVSRLIADRRAAIQAKLTVGAADDRYEREADQVAAQVMSANAAGGAAVSRQEDESGAQRKAALSITPLAQRSKADMRGSFDAGENVERMWRR